MPPPQISPNALLEYIIALIFGPTSPQLWIVVIGGGILGWVSIARRVCRAFLATPPIRAPLPTVEPPSRSILSAVGFIAGILLFAYLAFHISAQWAIYWTSEQGKDMRGATFLEIDYAQAIRSPIFWILVVSNISIIIGMFEPIPFAAPAGVAIFGSIGMMLIGWNLPCTLIHLSYLSLLLRGLTLAIDDG